MFFRPLALAIALVAVPSSADGNGEIVNILPLKPSTNNVNADAPAAIKAAIIEDGDGDAIYQDEHQLPKETIIDEYCFTSKEGLGTVLYAYIDQECSTSNCEIRQKYGEIGTWCTSGVDDMSYLFSGPAAMLFNDDISGWDVSSVTNMEYMFYFAGGFNQPLNGWDVSNVINMQHMFDSSFSFNQPLDAWDVSKVTDTSYMFYFAANFNQNLCTWGQVSSFPYGSSSEGMFWESGCTYTSTPMLDINGPFCASDCLTSIYI